MLTITPVSPSWDGWMSWIFLSGSFWGELEIQRLIVNIFSVSLPIPF